MTAAAGVHMPHWMSHGRPWPFSWFCCAWVQLGCGGVDDCQQCGDWNCTEAKAYREAHINDPEFGGTP